MTIKSLKAVLALFGKLYISTYINGNHVFTDRN